MSYWTTRRKIKHKAEEHINKILSNVEEHVANSSEHLNDVENPIDDDRKYLNAKPNVKKVATVVINEIDFEKWCEQVRNMNNAHEEEIFQKEDFDLRKEWANTQQINQSSVKLLLEILRVYHPYLPKDPRTLLKLDDNTIGVIKDLPGQGSYHHFGIANAIKEQLSCNHKLCELDIIKFKVNIDGLPLFKSTNHQLWPILGMLETTDARPFVIGIYYGKSKPSNVNDYLFDFVNEMTELQTSGVKYNDKLFQIALSAFICDAPARAFVKCVKGHWLWGLWQMWNTWRS